MKVDPNDLKVSQHDQEVAAVLLDALGKSLASANELEEGVVRSQDLHRVEPTMSAVFLETDPTLVKLKDFRVAGDYLGEMIAIFAKGLRDERTRTGMGLMDLAGGAKGSLLN